MRFPILSANIETFGFFEGIKFWCRMYVRDPIFFWCYETFGIRQWCPLKGWYCDDKNCEHQHYNRPPTKKDYPIKEDELCQYCGEEAAVTHICNPNFTDVPPFFWKVCKNCAEAIPLQEKLSLHASMMMKFPTERGRDLGEEKFRKTLQEIKEFEKRTGKKLSSGVISKLESGKVDVREL